VSSGPVLDLRTYRLRPGGRHAFDRIFREEALPMLRRAGIRVVGYGPSEADDDHYFLARAFMSRSERDEQLAAFYGSDEWRDKHDERVSALIESYHVVVVPLTPGLDGVLASVRSADPRSRTDLSGNGETAESGAA
jgi:NIPSNAP